MTQDLGHSRETIRKLKNRNPGFIILQKKNACKETFKSGLIDSGY